MFNVQFVSTHLNTKLKTWKTITTTISSKIQCSFYSTSNNTNKHQQRITKYKITDHKIKVPLYFNWNKLHNQEAVLYLDGHNSIAPPMYHLVNSSKCSSSYFTQVLEVI